MAERKSTRLVDLVTLLLTRRYGVRVDEIRRLRGYPRNPVAFHRQFERDKELLREMGFAVATREDPDDESRSVYFLDRGRTLLREVSFTAEELAALALARRLTAHLPLVGASVRAGLSRAGEPGLEDLAPPGVNCPAPPATGRREESRLRLLEEAIARDRRLAVRYQALGESRATAREIDPYALFLRGGAWYLLAYCHLRQAPRVFRVSRFLEARFAKRGAGPDFTLPKDFDLERYVDRYPFEVGHGTGGPVTLRFEPQETWRVGQGLGRRGRVERRAGGVVDLTLARAQTEALVSWVLGLGSGVRVVGPSGVCREIERVADLVAKRHEGGHRAPASAARSRPRPAGRRVSPRRLATAGRGT